MKTNKLADQIFCITGILSISRKEFKEIIEENGGKFSNTITKNVNYLITGENCGQVKLDKAAKCDIICIDEDAFWDLFEL